MPPTSIPGVQEPDSELARHERNMLNKMVKSIRVRTIDQIRSQTGRRQSHFDSVTGETFSAPIHANSLASRGSRFAQGSAGRWCVWLCSSLLTFTDLDHNGTEDESEQVGTTLASHLAGAMRITDSDDSDAGGVQLP